MRFLLPFFVLLFLAQSARADEIKWSDNPVFQPPLDCWLRGDANFDGEYSLVDVLILINFLPNAHILHGYICIDWADVDGNGLVESQDISYLLAYLFQGGPPPPDAPGVCCRELASQLPEEES